MKGGLAARHTTLAELERHRSAGHAIALEARRAPSLFAMAQRSNPRHLGSESATGQVPLMTGGLEDTFTTKDAFGALPGPTRPGAIS